MTYTYLSRCMGKPTICIGENKCVDQLRSNCESDQRLCFRCTDSTIPLLSKSKISSFFFACTARFVSDLVGTKLVGFLTHMPICMHITFKPYFVFRRLTYIFLNRWVFCFLTSSSYCFTSIINNCRESRPDIAT